MVLASKDNFDLIWNPKELFKQSLENTCLNLKIVHFLYSQFARWPWSGLYAIIFGFNIGTNCLSMFQEK